jgi:hypothetical protein
MTGDEIRGITRMLGYMKREGQVKSYKATLVGDVWFIRNKNNSVTMLPIDGSYKRTINPSWYE